MLPATSTVHEYHQRQQCLALPTRVPHRSRSVKINTNQARQRSEHETEESDQQHTEAVEHLEQQHSGVEAAASRVEEWLTYSSHSYERTPEVLDSKPRHRDVVNPASTRIGHVEDDDSDLSERLRRLHAERDSRM